MLKLRDSKLIFNFYKLICNIYCLISTNIENTFLRDNSHLKKVRKIGFFKYELNDLDLNKIIKYKHIRDNKYKQTRFLTASEIKKLINLIFNAELKEFITKNTGFKYSIDHFWFYEREKISDHDTDKQWYAHEYHFDKPYSNNMLKIFIPVDIIDKEASLSVLNKKCSKDIRSMNKEDIERNIISMTGQSDKLYGFFPRECWHKDGIPISEKPATQIMFQLNPSKKWSYNIEILNKQLSMEGRFPFIAYLFNKRVRI